MKWSDWLEKWQMTSLQINTPFLQSTWSPKDQDREAAWELYIELLTRITTQSLDEKQGDEKTALDSVYCLFSLSRDIMKKHGFKCIEFTKIAVVVLNQIVRPFTAKWHQIVLNDQFTDPTLQAEFRQELAALQQLLRCYTKMLADMAGVEDLTELEKSLDGTGNGM